MQNQAKKVSDAFHGPQIAALKRIEGQVRGIVDMIENGRYCVDILTLCKAVRAALGTVEEKILARHLDNCFADAMRGTDEVGRKRKIEEVLDLMRQHR